MFDIGTKVRFRIDVDPDAIEGFVVSSNTVFTWVDWGFGPEKEPTGDLEAIR